MSTRYMMKPQNFEDTAVKLTRLGKKHLGAAIDHTDFHEEFVSVYHYQK